MNEPRRTWRLEAVRNGTGKVELRTRVESNETELVLVPIDGSEALSLARTPRNRPARAESFKAVDASGAQHTIDVLIEQIEGRDGYVQRRLRTGEPVRAHSTTEFEAIQDGKLLRLTRLP